MMEIIKKNLVVVFIVLTLLILILIRATGLNHFSGDAKSHAEASMMRTNTITYEKFGSLEGDKLLIDLSGSGIEGFQKVVYKIAPYSILGKDQLNTILKHDGPVVLFSSEPAVASRIWMLLSQMGRENLFILGNTVDDEVLKYKFQNDTISQNVIIR